MVIDVPAKDSLFPTNLPELQWVQFPAAGFSKPICGVIYRTGKAPCCGVGLGGISTGCLDIDAHGVYGFSSLFNPYSAISDWVKYTRNKEVARLKAESPNLMPRKMPRPEPILALAVGGATWALASQEFIEGGEIPWCTEPNDFFCREEKPKQDFVLCPAIEGVRPAKEIHYWGHYPVLDIEYETDAPVSVGMRAWAPFIPGDAAASNIPAILFEVHVRNTSAEQRSGTIAFNFPGPDTQEAMATEFTRRLIKEDFYGLEVRSLGGVGYILGVISEEKVRFGGGLMPTRNTWGKPGESWAKIANELPQPLSRESQGIRLYEDSSASAAVDFSLSRGAQKTIRFLLAWYAPVWKGNAIEQSGRIRNAGDERMDDRWTASKWAGTQNTFTHMYAARYDGALDVARRIAVDHASLLKRIISWQSVLYSEEKLPVWLRDSLINSLEVIAEDSLWAQAKLPLGDWAFPGGAFVMQESPRGCPQTGVIPCDWLGNYPLVFFFPELALSQLRQYKAYQLEDGEVPLRLGIQGDLQDMATPGYFWHVSMNGMEYADMVDRLWQRTGDDQILEEFYDSVKQCNTFTMNLCKKGCGSVISIADRGGSLGMEHCKWRGMIGMLAGFRLAQLRIVERMARHMGDENYVEQCKKWYASGSKALEEELWTGTHYMNFYNKETGEKSEEVVCQLLDGQCIAKLHGLEGVFQSDRVKTTLETIKRCNMSIAPEVGPIMFTEPDGSLLPSELVEEKGPKDAEVTIANPPGHPAFRETKVLTLYGSKAVMPTWAPMLYMTYMYEGQLEFGLESAKKTWENMIIRQRHPWDPCPIHRADTGGRSCGTDYYQSCLLWALPAAIANENLATHCRRGGLLDRIIRAGRAELRQLPAWKTVK